MAENKTTKTTDNVVTEEPKSTFPTEIVELPSKGKFYPKTEIQKIYLKVI